MTSPKLQRPLCSTCNGGWDGGFLLGDIAERLAALRAVVADAIALKAPRRTVTCLGAAVAQALFRAAAPGSPSARACAREADEEEPARAKRRTRRGKRVRKEVVETEVASAAAAEPLVEPDKPEPVYKFGAPIRPK